MESNVKWQSKGSYYEHNSYFSNSFAPNCRLQEDICIYLNELLPVYIKDAKYDAFYITRWSATRRESSPCFCNIHAYMDTLRASYILEPFDNILTIFTHNCIYVSEGLSIIFGMWGSLLMHAHVYAYYTESGSVMQRNSGFLPPFTM